MYIIFVVSYKFSFVLKHCLCNVFRIAFPFISFFLVFKIFCYLKYISGHLIHYCLQMKMVLYVFQRIIFLFNFLKIHSRKSLIIQSELLLVSVSDSSSFVVLFISFKSSQIEIVVDLRRECFLLISATRGAWCLK